MVGVMTRYASTPPATMMPAIRGPMMYPTPSSGLVHSPPTAPPFSPVAASECSVSSRNTLNTFWSAVTRNPMPNPANSRPAALPPFSPAFSTSAQAVPSGYFSSPCFCTMNTRRSGIIMRMPSSPPSTPTVITRSTSMS